MKIFTVGNKSFVTSFQLAGVPGVITDTSQGALTEIRKLTNDMDVGLILASDDLTAEIGDELTSSVQKSQRSYLPCRQPAVKRPR